MSKRITLKDIQNLRMSSDDSDEESRDASRQQSEVPPPQPTPQPTPVRQHIDPQSSDHNVLSPPPTQPQTTHHDGASSQAPTFVPTTAAAVVAPSSAPFERPPPTSVSGKKKPPPKLRPNGVSSPVNGGGKRPPPPVGPPSSSPNAADTPLSHQPSAVTVPPPRAPPVMHRPPPQDTTTTPAPTTTTVETLPSSVIPNNKPDDTGAEEPVDVSSSSSPPMAMPTTEPPRPPSSTASSPRKTPAPSPRRLPNVEAMFNSPIRRSGDSDSESDEGRNDGDGDEEEDSPDFNSDTLGDTPISASLNVGTAGDRDTPNPAESTRSRRENEHAHQLNAIAANNDASADGGSTTTAAQDSTTSDVREVAPLKVADVLEPLGSTLNESDARRALHHQPASPTSLSSSSTSYKSFELDTEPAAGGVQGRPTRPYDESSPKRPSPNNNNHQHHQSSPKRNNKAGSNVYRRDGGYDDEYEGSADGMEQSQLDDNNNNDTMISVEMMEGYYNPIKSKYGLTARDLMKKRNQCAGKKIRFSSNVPTSLEERREAVVDFVRSMMISNQQTVQEIEERENARLQQRDDEISSRNPPMRFVNEVSLTPEQKLAIGLRAKEDYEREWSTFKQQPSRLQIIEEQQQMTKEGQNVPMRFVSLTEEERKKNIELAQLAADELDRRRQEKEINDQTEGFINRFQRSTTASRYAAEASFKELEEKTLRMEKAEELRLKPAADILCSTYNGTSPPGAPARLNTRLTATEKRRRQLLAEENQRKLDEEEARKKKLLHNPSNIKPVISSRLLQPTASMRNKEADIMTERRAHTEKYRARGIAPGLHSARASERGDNCSNAGGDVVEEGDDAASLHMSPSARVLARNFSRSATEVASLASPHNNHVSSPYGNRLSFSRGPTNASSMSESQMQSPLRHDSTGRNDKGTPLGLPETALARARREMNIRKREDIERREQAEMSKRLTKPYEGPTGASVAGLVGGGATWSRR